ncbi:hypothetical protein NTGM5_80003 [Candidatus Nitrotoga sp. M5]|nr:hypothetical protein NTGM5_80003 [Candidatus Nitrotoga sp. M5]
MQNFSENLKCTFTQESAAFLTYLTSAIKAILYPIKAKGRVTVFHVTNC